MRVARAPPRARVDGRARTCLIDVAGEGGDGAGNRRVRGIQARTPAAVLASSAPRIAPGQAWRKRFNLRGSSSILFEIASAGPVAAHTEGPGVTVALEPLLGNNAPRADGKVPSTWDVEAGWYVLRISPVNNAVGILDLTFGQPGLDAGAPAPSPPRTLIQLGVHDFDKDAYYQVFTNARRDWSPARSCAPCRPRSPMRRWCCASPGRRTIRSRRRAATDRSGPSAALPVRVPLGGDLGERRRRRRSIPHRTTPLARQPHTDRRTAGHRAGTP